MLESPSGARLSLRHEPCSTRPKAIVLLSHGLAEHCLRYQAFAEFLSQRGYHAFGFDHRGHGLTTASDAELGRFARRDGERHVLTDLAVVRRYAEATYPGLPVILFGHSMGGVIAARAAQEEPNAYAGLCIWNSKLDPGVAGRAGLALLKAERFFKGSDVPSFLGPSLVLEPWARAIPDARTESDWLSRDAAEVDRYIADPFCGFPCSVSLWIDLVAMSLRAGETRHLSRLPKPLPINLVAGGQDSATDNARAIEWLAERLKSLGITNVHLTIYPEMRHETLKEIGRERAMADLADWADGVVAGQTR